MRRARRLAIVAVLAVALQAGHLARADDAAPAAPDADFLALPAYDVEVPPAGAVRVGDQVPLKITGAGALPSAGGFRLALPKGMEAGAVLDQGLDVPALAAPSEQSAQQPSAPAALEIAGADLKFPVIAAKPGQLAVPSLAILDGAGKPVARTNPFSLQVKSAIAPTDKAPQEPAPPRPPVTLSFPWIVIAALVLLALLAIGGIIYGLVRWSRRARKIEAPIVAKEPPRSEDEIALAAFAELERQQLLAKGQYKQHYFQLSETLKAYVGTRFRVDAVESTTREMLAMLEHSTLQPESLRELESLFVKLDFVKFTDHVPDLPEGGELLARARSLVLKTRKPPQSQPAILSGALASAGASTQEPRRAL